MLELWLIRHGETDWNREQRTQGQSHNPLSARGLRQVRRLAPRLAGHGFDLIYSSDLRRALETARIAFPDAEPCLDERLRELSRGVLEGKVYEEYDQSELEILAEVRRDRYRNRPPEGECFYDLECRVRDWLAGLPENGKVAAVTHGGVIHTALRLIVGGDDGWSFSIDNASITRLLLGGEEPVILGVNDHGHLEGREPLFSDFD